MRKLKLGLVGLGFGKAVLKWYFQTPEQTPCIELKAVCDLNEDLAKTCASEYGVEAVTSFDALLADDEIDVIGLYTPPSGRAELLRKIIRAGKDVMTTKPFELDSEAARSVLKEAQELGRVIHLNSPSPSLTADLAVAHEWVEKYDLGRPVGIHCDVHANYFEQATGGWQDDPEKCPAGPMFRLGIYLMNDVTDMFGDVEAMQLALSKIRTGRPTADNATLQLQFKNGALGNIFASFCVGDGELYHNGMIMRYERGTIYRNVGTELKTVGDHRVDLRLVMADLDDSCKPRLVETTVADRPLGLYYWDELHAAVTEGKSIDDTYLERIVRGVKMIEGVKAQQREILGA